MSTTLKEKAVSGFKWTAFGQFGTQGVIMISSVILARLLSPAEFGLMAMLTVLIGFAYYFSSFGFGTSLIQQKEVSEADLSSVFWVNLGLGSILTILFAVAAPFIAAFYNEPSLKYLTLVVSLNFVVSSLSGVHIAILNRQLAFKQLSATTFCSILFSYSAAILCAYYGFGVWSLVVQSVVNSLSLSVFIFIIADGNQKFLISTDSLRRLSKVGGHIFFISIFDYIAINLDTILIGKYVNKKQLGEYGRANAFTMLPVVNVSSVLARVLMPTLAQIQDDKPRVAGIYFRTARVLAFIIFPMMAGLAIVAEPFVEVVFGSQWLGLAPMLQWFAPLGILASFNSIHDPIIVSQGRSDLLFKLAPFEKGLLIVSVFGGLYWGVLGIIVCKTIANILISIPKFWVLSKAIGVNMRDMYGNLIPFFVITCIMVIAVWGGSTFVLDSLTVPIQLGLKIVVGMIIYAFITLIFNRSIISELRSIVNK